MKIYRKPITIMIIITLGIIYSCTSSMSTAFAVSNNPIVAVGGETFGVKFYTNGDLIVRIEKNSPAERSGLKVNDIVTKINNTSIKSNEILKYKIENSNGKKLLLEIKRNDTTKNITVYPKLNSENIYKIGIWIKDSCAGIGTITYYDNNNDVFVGLGHGICDGYTNSLMPLAYGDVSYASVNGITKSKSGSPGGLNGYFSNDSIGKAFLNCNDGLYCKMNNDKSKRLYEIADKNEITTGKAKVYTTIDDNKACSYDVNISSLNYLGINSSSDFEVEITDKELLNKTGGIVQGMSGSPIIQHGKLIGAITHVFINNPNKGYGISAIRMYNKYEEYKK